MDFKETIKKNWEKILIIVLLLFSVSKCTSSCSRNQTIKRMTIEINQKDSTIADYAHTLDIMNVKQEDLAQHNASYEKIATGNQKELTDKINTLSNENANLKSANTKLTKEVADLNKKVASLTDELNKNK